MSAEENGANSYADRVLLTVHGITSDNSGLARLRERCEQELPGLIADSFYYGKVVPFKELTEDTAYAVFLHVRDRLELLYKKHGSRGRKLYIAAHSFGTLAVVRALEMRIAELRVEGLFLMGSIVPRYYYWDGLIESQQLKNPPVSVVRPLDRVVRAAFAVGGGSSGATGFIANGQYRPLETYKSGGHNAYHRDDGSDLIDFVRGGPDALRTVGRATWLETLGPVDRLRLRIL